MTEDDDTLEMIDEAEACIRSDFRACKITREQFQKEMVIMARARRQELARRKENQQMESDNADR